MPGTLTIVIPTYNEENNAPRIAKAIREMYPDFRVLFMDDNSTDKSRENVEALNDPMVRFFVRKPEERGLAASVMQGFIECGTDYFICMDCDFQHPIETLGPMYGKLEEGCDLVVGTRTTRKAMGFVRTFGSYAFSGWCKGFLRLNGKPVAKDLMSGLFGGPRELWAPILQEHWDELELQGWKVLLDMLKFGPKKLNIQNVEYEFEAREEGESHISAKVPVMTFHQCGRFSKVAAKAYAKIKGIDYYAMYPKEAKGKKAKKQKSE